MTCKVTPDFSGKFALVPSKNLAFLQELRDKTVHFNCLAYVGGKLRAYRTAVSEDESSA
jgi:hypothetical protein